MWRSSVGGEGDDLLWRRRVGGEMGMGVAVGEDEVGLRKMSRVRDYILDLHSTVQNLTNFITKNS